MIRLKEGVKVNGMRPEILLAICVAEQVFAEHGLDCVLTEVTGGTHSRGSLHYVGLGVDIRTRHIPVAVEKEGMAQTIRIALGDQYDVVLEKTHLHIEYQPKEQ